MNSLVQYLINLHDGNVFEHIYTERNPSERLKKYQMQIDALFNTYFSDVDYHEIDQLARQLSDRSSHRILYQSFLKSILEKKYPKQQANAIVKSEIAGKNVSVALHLLGNQSNVIEDIPSDDDIDYLMSQKRIKREFDDLNQSAKGNPKQAENSSTPSDVNGQGENAPSAPLTSLSEVSGKQEIAPSAPLTSLSDVNGQGENAPSAPLTSLSDVNGKQEIAPSAPLTSLSDVNGKQEIAPSAPLTSLSEVSGKQEIAPSAQPSTPCDVAGKEETTPCKQSSTPCNVAVKGENTQSGQPLAQGDVNSKKESERSGDEEVVKPKQSDENNVVSLDSTKDPFVQAMSQTKDLRKRGDLIVKRLISLSRLHKNQMDEEKELKEKIDKVKMRTGIDDDEEKSDDEKNDETKVNKVTQTMHFGFKNS